MVKGNGLGFRVRVLGFRVQGRGLGFRIKVLGFRVKGLRFRACGVPKLEYHFRGPKKG